MKFSKAKFRKNASKGIVRQLGKHVDVLDGMEVDFSEDGVNGTVEYEYEGEEFYLYPVLPEWCEEEVEEMEYKVLHGDYSSYGIRYSYIFCSLKGFGNTEVIIKNIFNDYHDYIDYTITLISDWKKNKCEIDITKRNCQGISEIVKEFKTINEAEPIIDDEFVKKYLEEVLNMEE